MVMSIHMYFVPECHLRHDLTPTGSGWMQVGDCLAQVRYARSDLYAVILVSPETTPCLQRRQILRMLANEETSSTPLSDAVTRLIQGIEVPAHGPVPLVSLSRLMRQNPTDWYEIYEGRAKRIKCRSLLSDLNAVSIRGDDSNDVRVECLPSALGHDEDRDDRFTQCGAFAAIDLPACTVCASYSRGAMMTPVEAFESSPSLREFDFEVNLGSSSSRLVVTGNPLVNSATMCNDARGSGKEPNAELFVALFVSLDGSRELHVMLQTTKQIKAGMEILVDYGEAFWRAWAGLRDAVSEARGQILADLLHEIGC